ncbi:MAG: trigger factor [Chloroflexi bacterium]|nr:trigger factor [Chloroflexota bacterium]
MKVTQESTAERQTVLTIEVEEADLGPYMDRAYRKVSQQVNIPGFRRGKAPRPVVERFLGKGALLAEALETLVPEMTSRAIDQQGLVASAQPQVELAQQEPPIIKAIVPLEPEVDLGDHRAIRLAPASNSQVDDAQVEAELERLRQGLATWEPVERPIQLGDLAVLDVTARVDGRTILSQQDLSFLAKEDASFPLPGFVNALVGLGRGKGHQVQIRLPEDFRSTSLAGKECQVVVNVKDIKLQRLPPLDDELAKSVGDGYESLEALRKEVHQRLQAQAEEQEKRAYQEKVVQTLLEQAKVTLPPLLVEHEIEHLLQDQEEALRQRKISMDDYLKNVGKSAEQVREELRQQAVQRLIRAYVLDKVGKEEGIEVGEEEVQKEIQELGQGQQGELLRRFFDNERGKDSLHQIIRNRKVLERLAAIAQGGPGTEQEGPQSGKGGETEA